MSVVVGLTGNIACGKSTVGEILKKYNIKVLDSDEVVHKIYGEDKDVQAALLKEFGSLDRKEIGAQVFGKENKEKRQILEGIIHPKVDTVFRDWVLENQEEKILVNLVPLLFEAKLESRYDFIAVVKTSPKLQLERLLQRNTNMTIAEAQKRIDSQMPMSQKIEKADFVLDNSINLDDLEIQVEEMLEKLGKSS